MTSIIDISKLLLNSSQKTITVQVQRAQCYKMEGGGGGGGGIVGLMSRNVGRRGEGRAAGCILWISGTENFDLEWGTTTTDLNFEFLTCNLCCLRDCVTLMGNWWDSFISMQCLPDRMTHITSLNAINVDRALHYHPIETAPMADRDVLR